MDIILDPFHQMILESAFDDLMQQIRRNEFMDVCIFEIIRKWLSRPRQLVRTTEARNQKKEVNVQRHQE
jgi:hypothetical protein